MQSDSNSHHLSKEPRARLADYSSSTSSVSQNFEDLRSKTLAPFYIRWIHGYNHKAGVINLNYQGSTIAFYAAANCGVLYNWTMHQMQILQGHTHMVTCIASDAKGDWLVTADSGAENVLIIWDRSDLFPQRTLFSPHGKDKIAKVAMSADAKYLLTMAYSVHSMELRWWIWSYDLSSPHALLEILMERESVLQMEFNPYHSEEFCFMTKNNIWIGVAEKVKIIEREIVRETDNWALNVTSPIININPEYGKHTCFTFVQNTRQILAGTTRGSVIVYGYTMEYKADAVESLETVYIEELRFIKVLKVEMRRINVIKSIDNVIITGNILGQMHIYDDQLKLLYWIHGFPIDNIKEISFNMSPRRYKIFDTKCQKLCMCWENVVLEKDLKTGEVKQKLHMKKIPIEATTSGKPLIVRDFLINTLNEGIVFVEFIAEKTIKVVDNRIAHVATMTVHPEKPCICMGYTDGTLVLYDFDKHKIMMKANLRGFFTIVIPPKDDSINSKTEKIVPRIQISCVKYSPSGLHLACGLNTGELVFLHPSSLDLITPKSFKDLRHVIKLMSYSSDSLTLACADAAKTVCVYKYDCKEYKWVFVAKHRSHFKNITTLIFLPEKNEGATDFNLLSIGRDRLMVEYDVSNSSDEYLEIMSLDRISQSATPLNAILWPTPPGLDPEQCRQDLPLILVATDEFKYKIVNYATTMTLATILGPRYESPVYKMQLITDSTSTESLQYLLYATRDVIGLQKLPLDGNPWKHVGMLGHPNKIIDMAFREDLGMLFTIGDRDTTVTQWAVNFRSVEISTENGGSDLDPYYCLIENMRPGWLFQEIRDLFYYVQILCQGTFSPAMRRVKDFIPIDSLPDLMRALGFFPSEYSVENLLVEAKYKVYLRQPVAEIDFEEFVKLYLNHRPAFGEKFKRITFAFRNFASIAKTGFTMKREDFIKMLTTNGECFSRELAWYLLSILCGHSCEDRALMTEDDFSFLPENITFQYFVDNIIGMQDMEDISENYSHLDSVMSLHSRGTVTSEISEDKFFDDLLFYSSPFY